MVVITNFLLFFSDLWFFDGTATWKLVTNSLNLTAANHSAYISILPSFTTDPTNITIYFLNNLSGANNNISLVTFDVNKNMSYFHYNGTQRNGAVVSLFGTQWFYYGGNSQSGYHYDLWQFVDEKYCTSVADCEVCVDVFECGWCNSAIAPGAPSCVAGNSTGTIITPTPTCNSISLLTQVENCPELFPSWAIALIVIGGVILVGGIVFGIMKLRSGKPGYDPVT